MYGSQGSSILWWFEINKHIWHTLKIIVIEVVIIYQMLCEVLYFVVRHSSRYYFYHFHLDLLRDYVHFNSIGLVVSPFEVLEVFSRHFVNVGIMLHHGRSNILVADENNDLSSTM